MSNDEPPKNDDETPRIINMKDQEVEAWMSILNFYFPPRPGEKHEIDASQYPDKLFIKAAGNRAIVMRDELYRQNFDVQINADNGTVEMDTSEMIYPSHMEGLRRHVERETALKDIMGRVFPGGDKDHPRINKDPDEGKGGPGGKS